MEIRREDADALFLEMGLATHSFKDYQVLERLRNLPELLETDLEEPTSPKLLGTFKKIMRVIAEGEADQIRVIMAHMAHRQISPPKPVLPADDAYDRLMAKLWACDVTTPEGRTHWDAANGESVREGGALYFSTGAYRESNPLGIYMPPDKDPHQRAVMIEKFWEIKARQARQTLKEVGDQLRWQANGGHLDQAALFQVKELRKVYDTATRERQQAIKKVEETDPSYKTPEQRQREAQEEELRGASRREYLEELEKLTKV